jgi:hypothetical protein
MTVIVTDTTPPALICPPAATAECAGPSGAQAAAVATAMDACSPSGVVVVNSRTGSGGDASGVYPLGTNTVTFTATDPSGNTASCETAVTVRDTTPPALTLSAEPAVLWPPNHRLVPVGIGWQAADVCDPEPRDGDGRTTPDLAGYEIGTADPEILLRAERSGTGTGRVYELTYGALDVSGNRATALQVVTVPHDLGEGPEPLLFRVGENGTPGMVELYWNAVKDATGYDVIAGDVGRLRVEGGKVELGSVRVLGRAQTATSWSEPPDGVVPAPSRAQFYLVQARYGDGRTSGFGTESVPVPREPTRCEGACP